MCGATQETKRKLYSTSKSEVLGLIELLTFNSKWNELITGEWWELVNKGHLILSKIGSLGFEPRLLDWKTKVLTIRRWPVEKDF